MKLTPNVSDNMNNWKNDEFDENEFLMNEDPNFFDIQKFKRHTVGFSQAKRGGHGSNSGYLLGAHSGGSPE